MSNNNIEMTHKEHKDLKEGLFGIKKFEVIGKKVIKCPFMGKCDVLYENYAYCCSLKYKKCIQYLIEILKEVHKNVQDNLKKNLGKCIIIANEKQALSSNKKDMRVKYDIFDG